MKSAIIVAAGESTRFGTDKLNMPLLESNVLQRSVNAFAGIADEIIVVGRKIDGAKYAEGGSTRTQSVASGLRQVSPQCTVVAIHDAARPFVSRALVQKLFDEALRYGSAVPRLPVTDTIWRNGQAAQLVVCNRSEFFTVQTPQVFNFAQISQAFAASSATHTDESTLFFEAFGAVHFVDGETSNRKITVPADLPQFRIGAGFDVHAFGAPTVQNPPGVILGGVHIPYEKILVGHSDADVLAHSICDAVLSASGNRDIGVQFPDTDPAYLGANSLELLSRCVQLASSCGYAVQNVTAVVVCQQPKIAPHIPQMAQNLAQVLKILPSCVNISATTTERLGALGNGDGIAVQAQALLAAVTPV